MARTTTEMPQWLNVPIHGFFPPNEGNDDDDDDDDDDDASLRPINI